ESVISHMTFPRLLLLPLLLTTLCKAENDPVAPWTKGVKVSQVSTVPGRHTMHTYYLTNPESPDGKRVLFYASTDPKGHIGQVCIIDRATGKETVLADNVHTEDAHRVACQQWLSGGKRVVFHEVIGKRWRVVVVDMDTLAKTVIAEDHQLAFGQPNGDWVPMYGCHWNPGPYRDLEVWDAATGKTRTMVRIAEVEAKYGAWLNKEFVGKPTSIFEPTLSPDLKRVFFKIAAGNGGDDYMTKAASHRQGLVCYSFEKNALTWRRDSWGHPAWHPDSKHIIEVGNVLYDSDGGPATKVKELPYLSGSHPSVSPDGKLQVTDGVADKCGGKPKEWGIVVGDMRGGKWALVHSFDQSQGAKSWRVSHPHPAFSADGKRIYFNVSDGPFTRLCVAERTTD
ncbi:MAG: hypothetical protein JWO89_2071, partial [Verrucomicrobiaceae bacterium]|nr:hypothetical protein [Verrucomicrobiaceae bacterium]